MPWRNGLGTTTEIAAEPSADGRFHWRLSIADVAQSGPFSSFEGYDRTIAVVAGAGMRLAVAGQPDRAGRSRGGARMIFRAMRRPSAL